jgi:uncharacterized membrane protein YhhN
MEATRPVDPAKRSLKTEQRATKGSCPSLLEPDPRPPCTGWGLNNSVMSAAALCTRWRVSDMTTLLWLAASHATLFTESLILAQDERWRRA